MTKIIRLTEGDLHRIIENSVRRVLKEEESRNGKGTGVDKLSDSELIAKYKLEKKFLKGDFTDDEVRWIKRFHDKCPDIRLHSYELIKRQEKVEG